MDAHCKTLFTAQVATLFGLRSLKSRRQGNLSTNVHVQRVELVLRLVTTTR